MPDLDLEPHEYTSRKPKGWRWRLPWGNPEDSKLFLVLAVLSAGFVGYFVLNTPAGMDPWIIFGAGLSGFFAGACLLWSLRD